jgi:hypothetical protein
MRTRGFTLVGAVLVVGMLTTVFLGPGALAAGSNSTTLATSLSGEEEVCTDPSRCGDPDGTGTAAVELDRRAGTVCFSITTSNVALPLNAAHIHEAPAGTAGPVVVPLFTTPSESETVTGCVTGVDSKLIKDIEKHPEEYYVNVHNSEYPDGAVRGQLGDSVAA